MTRAYYDTKPPKLEAVGNGNYLYNWDIKEETKDMGPDMESITQYSCLQVTVVGEPSYEKIVEAVIRSNYTTSEELALINKFNSYNEGIITDGTIVEEYKAYLQFAADTKKQAKTLFDSSFKL